MREIIEKVASYYLKQHKAVLFRTEDKHNTAMTQAYHGYDIVNKRLINIVAIELPSATQPIMASEKDMKIVAHVEQLGDINYRVPDQLAILLFFCEEEGTWYRMNLIQLKEYWITKSLRTASVKELEKLGLVTLVRNTTFGPDILGMIDRPFQVIESGKDWLDQIFG